MDAGGDGEAVRRLHALWTVKLAEHAEPHLFTADETIWLHRLRREQANLFAATEWAIAHDPGLALRLVGTLPDVWYLQGQVEKGVECLRRTLQAAPAATQWAIEARALAEATNDRSSIAMSLAALGSVVQYERDYPCARTFHQQALAIFTELGDQP